MSNDFVRLKRQVTIKTIINEAFRQRASGELSNEVRIIDEQLGQLDISYQKTLQQLESLAQQGQNVKGALDQLNHEAQAKRNQLTNLKVEVTKQLSNLDKVPDGEHIVTGILESFVDVAIGDNIYEKVQNCYLIIEDGLVKEIRA